LPRRFIASLRGSLLHFSCFASELDEFNLDRGHPRMAIEKVKAGYSYSLGRGLPRRFIARVLALALLALLAGTALAQTPAIDSAIAHDLTNTSFAITWTGSNLPDLDDPDNYHMIYEVRLLPNDGEQFSGARSERYTFFYNLTPNTDYDVAVKLLDLDAKTTVAEFPGIPLTFTSTLEDSASAARTLSDVEVSDITATSAVVTWTGSTQSDVVFGLSKIEADTGLGGYFHRPVSSPFTLTGLTPDTTYDIKVHMDWKAKRPYAPSSISVDIKEVEKTFTTLPVGQGAPPSEQDTILYSSPVVEEEPPPPLKNLRLDRIDHNSVRVRWGGQDFRGEKGSYIYRIKIRPIDGVSKSADRQTRRKRVTVNKLSANTLYTAEVQLVREADDKVLRSLSEHFSTARK